MHALPRYLYTWSSVKSVAFASVSAVFCCCCQIVISRILLLAVLSMSPEILISACFRAFVCVLVLNFANICHWETAEPSWIFNQNMSQRSKHNEQEIEEISVRSWERVSHALNMHLMAMGPIRLNYAVYLFLSRSEKLKKYAMQPIEWKREFWAISWKDWKRFSAIRSL